MTKHICRYKYFFIAAVLAWAVIFTAIRFYNSSNILPSQDASASFALVGGAKIFVEVATSTAAIQTGLSGRTSLDADRGMIFVFPKPDKYRFWMPDMNFPVDIIWINGDKVIGITKIASNEFDSTNPVFYAPSNPARYVLEVNAGFIENRNINIGDEVVLYNIK